MSRGGPRFRQRVVCIIALFALMRANGVLAQQDEQPLPVQLSQQAVARVKQATVRLYVVTAEGTKTEGSGFFALKPGMVITNAHVLGMLGKQSGAPQAVDVVVNSGEANEAELKGTVVGVDRENDLGIVRVEGVGLPTPLAIEAKRPLFETQKVYIFGYPFGTQIGKNITISESSVSSLRRDAGGTLQQVQVNGGLHPGNSGGPLVNSEGKVIGVAVAVIRGTMINFAIPSHLVSGLSMGRVTESRLGEPVAQDGKVSLPVKVSYLDPLAQVKELNIEVWTGMPDQPVPASLQEPKARPGEGKRQSIKLALKKGVGQADVVLPAIPADKVCWLQPVIVTRDNKTHWGPALATPVGLVPVERKPVKLAADFEKVKERTVKLKSVSSETFTRGKIAEVVSDKVEVDMLEVFSASDKNSFMKIAYGPTVNIKSEVNGRPLKLHAETSKMFRALPPSFIINPTGGLQSRVSRSLNPKLPIELREDFLICFGQLCSSMEATMVPIPDRALEALAKYGTNVALIIGSPNTGGGKGDKTVVAKTVDLLLTCTYEGTRTRNGREEALMTFVGRVKGRSKGTEGAKGDVSGKYAVDLAGGFVSLVKTNVTTEIEGPGGEFRLTYALDVDMDRRPGNPLNIPVPKK